MRTLVLAALSSMLLAATATAGERAVTISARGECRRPRPPVKDWTPCAAVQGFTILNKVQFLLLSQGYDRELKVAPRASSNADVCLDDNEIEFMREREELQAELKSFRAWAEAAKDIDAVAEHEGCIDMVGGHVIGGEGSDHPERMANNILFSAFTLTHHHDEARKRNAKPELTAVEEVAAVKEAGEFSRQREFLLSQLAGLEAWTEKTASVGTLVAVKDPPPVKVDGERLEQLIKEAKETLKEIEKMRESLDEAKKRLDEMPRPSKALLAPLAPPVPLRPLKRAEPKPE